jgi:hypothetical protein
MMKSYDSDGVDNEEGLQVSEITVLLSPQRKAEVSLFRRCDNAPKTPSFPVFSCWMVHGLSVAIMQRKLDLATI